MLAPSSRMFHNQCEYKFAYAMYWLLVVVFAGMTSMATLVYWRNIHVADIIREDAVDMATPLFIDVCEKVQEVRQVESMLPFFQAVWVPESSNSHREINGAAYQMSDGAQQLRCLRFTVPDGLPGRLPSVNPGWVALRTSRPAVETRTANFSGDVRLVGMMIRISIAKDPAHPVALQHEVFTSETLPQASGQLRAITFSCERKHLIFRDSFGGRFGATVNDTSFFKPSSVNAPLQARTPVSFGGKPFPWEVHINVMESMVTRVLQTNDIIGDTVSYVANVFSFMVIFRLMSVLFVADGTPIRFMFNVPCLGLGVKSEAEEQPLVRAV